MGKTKNFGVVYIAADGERLCRTYANMSAAETFAQHRTAAGEKVVRLEEKVAGEWRPMPVAAPAPATPTRRNNPNRTAEEHFLAARTAVLDRDSYVCQQCGGIAATVAYLPDRRPVLGVDDPNRLNPAAMAAICRPCTLVTAADQSGPYTSWADKGPRRPKRAPGVLGQLAA